MRRASLPQRTQEEHTGSLSLLKGEIILIEVLLLLLGGLQGFGLAAWEADELVDCIALSTGGETAYLLCLHHPLCRTS